MNKVIIFFVQTLQFFKVILLNRIYIVLENQDKLNFYNSKTLGKINLQLSLICLLEAILHFQTSKSIVSCIDRHKNLIRKKK